MPTTPWLTSDQNRVSARLQEKWSALASPTVIVLNGPSGRGKTRIVQAFYDHLCQRQPQGQEFWKGSPATDTLDDWRQNRKTVNPPSFDVNLSALPAWLWFGIECYPSGQGN